MTTYAEAQEIITRNSRKKSVVPKGLPLSWTRVTGLKLVSADGKYCILKCCDRSGAYTYDAWACGPRTDYAQLLAEKLKTPQEAKAICDEAHQQGEKR